MCDLTYKAFELAFTYRNPAIVLTDAVIGQMMETLVLPERGP
jgi:pyruvate/2-oxoacid:ferredoxin oxidoreductase alpha subunit